MYKELHRSVFVRPQQLIEITVNETPNLGVALYIDPKYRENPVLEIAQLQLNKTRSVVNSFQDDRKLVTWDSKKRDDFYAEALRSSLASRFFGVKQEHWAHVNAGINLIFYDVASNVAGNFKAMTTSPSEFEKDIDGSIFWKAVKSTLNNEAAIAESLLISGINPQSASKVIAGVFKAAEALPQLYRDPQQFQAVIDWGRTYAEQIIQTGETYGDYVNNVRNNTAALNNAKAYFGARMDNLEILAVTPAPQSQYDNLVNGERDPDDFSGYFAVRGHWYDGGHCKGIWRPEDARKEGFNIGPAYLRQYQALMSSLAEQAAIGAPPTLMKSNVDTRLPTAIDLPANIAQQRLDYLEQFGLKPAYPDASRELREIVMASSLGRAVDLSLFRDCSIRHAPALRFIENYELKDLEKACSKAQKRLEALQSDPGASPKSLAKAELNVNTYKIWRSEHPDHEIEDAISLGST